ncbi:CAP domain-containing protein [Lederbergia lenta]|uniref:CAP domain-containing protein n=1 Tax=Lederbergia lenta TaxID=1467 RepID=UPI0008260D8D|nr:CAP domain-containing protein [Lederbergia lenta]MEC2323057.1 CAP domain-containing protein [Lederbergia lenta]
MKRFLLLLLIIGIAYISKPVWEDYLNRETTLSAKDSITTKMESIKNNPDVATGLNAIADTFHEVIGWLDGSIAQLQKEQEQSELSPVEKPTLTAPEQQKFSLHNIELGDSKDKVEQAVGAPKRVSKNEYGVDWYSYHENYQNFMMISYSENDIVNGLYTNQDLISSSNGVKLGSSKESVKAYLGEPITQMRKGFVYYQIQDNGEYEIYQIDNSYITVFYDQHENNTVTAIQIIDLDLEGNRKDMYTKPSEQLKEGFEYQLFDLTNASRVNHNLGILTWDDHVKETARKHSIDMAENAYFNHENLRGQSPFDRMHEDNIAFIVAGENLAYGQFSSIFAHEGLMNSIGHRENILKPDYQYLGVGVAFNEKSQPYYTENFFSN